MGYDYTLGFLRRHQNIVDMVRDCFDTGGTYKNTYVEASDMMNAQKLVNNIMRSLAVNYPDQFMNLRKTIRTWTDPAPGKFILYVGPAWDKMPGRRPVERTTTEFDKILDHSVQRAMPKDEYLFPEPIKEQEQFVSFLGRVLELKPEVKRASAEFTVEIDLEYFSNLFIDHGWIAHLNGPTTLMLERP